MTKTNDTRRKSVADQITLKDAALELLRHGVSQTDISRRLQLSRFSVNKWAAELAKDPNLVASQAKRGRKKKGVQS